MHQIERLLGKRYPVSIGTANIFENENFDIRQWPTLFYINIRTLYRNYVASIRREDYDKIDDVQFTQDFLNEVAEVERIIKEVSNNQIRVLFYYPKLNHLKKVLPKTERKDYNPELFDLVEENMWDYVKHRQLFVPFHHVEIDEQLPPANEPILLLSSHVVDLLQASKFPSMTLIESFTGKLKKRQDWYTKLRLSKSKEGITYKVPFNKFTIQIFGDKSGLFKPADVRLRRCVAEMAQRDNWLSVSTYDRIKASINKITDKKIKDLLYTYL